MPMYIKDSAVGDLAEQYQKVINAPSKTEAVRLALKRALELELKKPDVLADIAVAFARDLRAKANFEKALPVDKAYQDSLYD